MLSMFKESFNFQQFMGMVSWKVNFLEKLPIFEYYLYLNLTLYITVAIGTRVVEI